MGCPGSITTDCWSPSATSRPPRLRQTTTGISPSRSPYRPDLNQPPSTEPGPIQGDHIVKLGCGSALEHRCLVLRQGGAFVELATDVAIELAHGPTAAQRLGLIEATRDLGSHRQQAYVGDQGNTNALANVASSRGRPERDTVPANCADSVCAICSSGHAAKHAFFVLARTGDVAVPRATSRRWVGRQLSTVERPRCPIPGPTDRRGCASSCGPLARERIRAFDTPGAAFADPRLGGSGDLGERVAVLLELVHLLIRDLLAGNPARLRIFEVFMVSPPPEPARLRLSTGQDSCRRPAKVIGANHRS